MEEVREVVVKSTPEGMKRFIQGTIWEDMVNELNIWSEELRSRYDTCASLENLRYLQGARETVHYCLQLPHMFMKAMEQDLENEEEEGEE